jgi:hypothetical protein
MADLVAVRRLPGRAMSRAMRRFPQIRYRLWRITVWYQHRTRHLWRAPVLWRVVHWLWCHTAPLGRCDQCSAPTWNPVTFYVQQPIGRTGHYYCERCGPPMLQTARALSDVVTE